jgi:hypothetical protein
MIFFSFSLYGTLDMYTKGMIENVKIINRRFPNAIIQIYIADDVPNDIKNTLLGMPNVRLIYVRNKPGTQNMFDRFQAIDDPECTIMFVRDADSRIHDRDYSCIEDFLNSDKILHIIRDHRFHTTAILGGLWGIKKIGLNEKITTIIQKWISKCNQFNKGIDQHFLAKTIYPSLRSRAMIHDRFNLYESINELTPFRVEIIDKLFCGQVHKYDSNGIEYTECNP